MKYYHHVLVIGLPYFWVAMLELTVCTFAEVGHNAVVTPKLDMLLLELLTGKQPAEDPSFGESLHVVAWVKEKV